MGRVQHDAVWTPFRRSGVTGTYRLTGLTSLFIFMVLALSIASCSAVWHASNLGLGVSSVTRIAKAVGVVDGERVRDGHDPSAVSLPAPKQGQIAGQGAEAESAPVSPQEPARMAGQPTAGGATPAPSEGDRMRIVNTDGLGVVLRTAPREDARVPRGLSAAAQVTVLGRAGDQWVQVRGENGLEGWVPTRYLAPAN